MVRGMVQVHSCKGRLGVWFGVKYACLMELASLVDGHIKEINCFCTAVDLIIIIIRA